MNWEQIPEWAQAVAHSLLKALKQRDAYTYGHSLRVAHHSQLLGEAAGLNAFDQRCVEFASLFHDLGKIGIPDSVLLKPARLDAYEEAIIRAHPIKSEDILGPLAHIPIFASALPGIRHHHERIDGGGYPDGLIGEDIPLASRIILISDTFDAMTTTRPYRAGLPFERAYKELVQFAGTQFDFQLVKLFIRAHPTWKQMENEHVEEAVFGDLQRVA
ncbi:MAG: hypothetical protein A2X94_17375 [Bdellovibrionales bacterium GWB1_55_8]|nr:MAG: hypothetical protein A2X94_17375 [Bdellovibrionales bacterium GWB1_55_8]